MTFSRFGRGGCFVCIDCGKKTRETDVNNGTELCPFCCEVTMQENALRDGAQTREEFNEDLKKIEKRYKRKLHREVEV